MQKFISNITDKEKKLYSINFLLSELHEIEAESKDLAPAKELPSSQYRTHHLDTYTFYKPIATNLNLASIERLKEKDS